MRTPRRWIGIAAALVAITSIATTAARAVLPDEVLPNPALEARARALSRELRCMVCQNQSIDDSEAPLARDLRILVRERLSAGDSDKNVLEFLTARYGEFVLLKPPLAWHTALLWFGPAALLIIGAAALVVVARRRRSLEPRSGPGELGSRLTPSEEARLKSLLADPAGSRGGRS